MVQFQFPFISIVDPSTGDPISFGNLYVGNPDTDPKQPGNRVQVRVLQEDLTPVDIEQPVVLTSGGVISYQGSPAVLDIDAQDYSVLIEDRNDVQVYYRARSNEVAVVPVDEISVFDSIADASAANIVSSVDTLQILGFYSGGDGGEALYKRVPSEPSHAGKFQSNDGAWWEIGEAEVNVLQFGARGDVDLTTESGGTDDSSAFQNAYNYAFDFSKIMQVPDGRGYRLSSSINCYNDTDLTRECGFEGDTFLTSVLYNDVADNTTAMLNFSGTSRQNRKTLGNLRLRRHGNLTNTSQQAAYVDLGELGGNSRIFNLECGGSRNTHIRARGQSNVYMNDIVTFGGGALFPYKNTSGITFTGSLNSTTVTASSPIFTDGTGGTTNDAGNMIFFDNSNEGGTVSGQYLISSVDSTTQVTLSTPLQQEMTGSPGIFEPPRVNGSSGGATLTAESNCFFDHHVGLYIWVVNGDSAKGLARRRIVSLNGAAPTNQVVVDEPFDKGFGNNQFGTAVIEIQDANQSGATESNDLGLERFHIEDFRGVGLVVDRASRFTIRRMKIHALASQNDNTVSVAHAWWANVQGVINDIILDGNQRGRAGKFLFAQQGVRTFRINDIMFNGHFNDEFIQTFAFSGAGRVVVNDITVAGNIVSREDITLFDDNNTIPRVSGNGLYATTRDEDFTVFLEGQVYRASASGTPEGNFTAPIGSTYHRLDGSSGTSFYVKESGTGNTGWAAK